MSLIPLAAPKGVKLSCELCQRPAHVQCTQCRVTNYCCEAHQEEDWEAIHQKICPLLSVLHRSHPPSLTQEERRGREAQQEMRKRHIVQLALQEGQQLLCLGQAHLAIPAAMQALKFLTELGAKEGGGGGGGGGGREIAPVYLLLSEAAIQLGHLSQAGQYLSQVQWTVIQSPDTHPHLLASLHRCLGQLAIARGNLKEARSHFAEDIYQSSVAHGTDAPQTAGGLFHLSHAFLAGGQTETAISLQSQAVSCWLRHLSELSAAPKKEIDTQTRVEAQFVLNNIRELQEKGLCHPPPPHPHPQPLPHPLLTTYHSLALLYCMTGEVEKATKYAQQALELCSHGNQEQTGLHGNQQHASLQSILEALSKHDL